MYIVSPSLLACDKKKVKNEIIRARNYGAQWIHYDIMDGKFVPNTSFPIEVISKTKNIKNIVKDVHIMIDDPLTHAKEYLDAGADYLTFHIEAVHHPNEIQKTIDLIKKHRKKVGISIKPLTDVDAVIPYLRDIDLVLVMSVEPGLGGQKFIPSALAKITKLKAYIREHNLNCLVEVDGGINNETGKQCKEAGVDVLVAGSYLYGHDDMEERLKGLLDDK